MAHELGTLIFLGGGHLTPRATPPFSWSGVLKRLGSALPQARLDDLYESLNPEGSSGLGAPIPYLSDGDKSYLSSPDPPSSLHWLEALEVHPEPGDWAFSLRAEKGSNLR